MKTLHKGKVQGKRAREDDKNVDERTGSRDYKDSAWQGMNKARNRSNLRSISANFPYGGGARWWNL